MRDVERLFEDAVEPSGNRSTYSDDPDSDLAVLHGSILSGFQVAYTT